MNITIYQVNIERDTNRIAFMGYDSLEHLQGSKNMDCKIYDKVYEGNLDLENLEEVYNKFNFDPPENYRARSVSVSDVVAVSGSDKVKDGFYFCNDVGFKEVEFDPGACFERNKEAEENTITVLLVEPNKYPKMVEIDDSLEAMQELVGGEIEEYMPYEDDIAIVCNEEGKMNGLPLNRAIFANPEERKDMVDIVAGKFFVTYAPPESESYCSLPDELTKKYKEVFKYPERFYRNAPDSFTAEPFKPREKEHER